MTVFDYVVIGILVASLLFGLLRGMVGELIALAAWALAIVAAIEWGAQLGQTAFVGIADANVRTLAGCVLIFVGVLVAMAMVRLLIKRLVSALGLTVSDRLLGAFFGIARGVLIAMVLVALGGMTAAPQQAWWRQAMLGAA